jgi:hypothetical protein
MGLRNPEPSMRVLMTVCIIVGGVMLASIGEVQFVMTGVILQLIAIVFEGYKHALQQSLLAGKKKMSSLTLLYYFAPACAVFNFLFVLIFEAQALRSLSATPITKWTFLTNAILTFGVNVASVTIVSLFTVKIIARIDTNRFKRLHR